MRENGFAYTIETIRNHLIANPEIIRDAIDALHRPIHDAIRGR